MNGANEVVRPVLRTFGVFVLSVWVGMAQTAWGVDTDLKITSLTEFSVFPESGKGAQEDVVFFAQVKPDLALTFDSSLGVVLAPRFRLGISDSEYHLVSLDDLYGEYISDRWEIRLGYQTFFWGTVESGNIVDILNQEDFVGDFLDPEKLGEPSLRARFMVGDHRIDLFWLQYFTPAPLPAKVHRFNFFDGFMDISDDPFYSGSSERLRQQFAVRWDYTILSADLGLSYFNGYERFPVIFLSPGQNKADTFYYEVQQVGSDIQMSLENWLLKGEAIFQDTGIA